MKTKTNRLGECPYQWIYIVKLLTRLPLPLPASPRSNFPHLHAVFRKIRIVPQTTALPTEL